MSWMRERKRLKFYKKPSTNSIKLKEKSKFIVLKDVWKCSKICGYNPFRYILICPSIHILIHPSICLSIHLSVYPSIYLSSHPSICICILLSVYKSIYLSIHPYICLYILISVNTSIFCLYSYSFIY